MKNAHKIHTEHVNVRISPTLLREAEAWGEGRRIGRSAAMRALIEKGLEAERSAEGRGKGGEVA